MVHSYAYASNLFYEAFNLSQLPQNLWCGKVYSYVDWDWVNVGFFTISDLPQIGDKIDVIAVTTKLQSVGCTHSPYLLCCAFQTNFTQFLYFNVPGTFVPNELLLLPLKKILQDNLVNPLGLTKWCTFLRLVPLEIPECEQIFQRMLVSCKITKFRDINFKILARILITPKILAYIHKEDNITWYAWYSIEGFLEHILLDCQEMREIHKFLSQNSSLQHNLAHKTWIFGTTNPVLNPIIWVTNFVIYKAHLMACDGSRIDLMCLLHDDMSWFALLFPILQDIDWSSVFQDGHHNNSSTHHIVSKV